MRRKFFLQLHNLKGLRMVRQMRRGFTKTLYTDQRGAENESDTTGFWSVVYK